MTGGTTMDRFRKVFKWWFAWNPEKVEDYLESMSLQGWHAVHADGLLINFFLERGEPKHIRYCMDYQRSEKPEYVQIFMDDGWKLLGSSMGWHLWSREYEGVRPEIYTDADSLIRRNRGLLSVMLIILLSQGPLIWVNTINLSRIWRTEPETYIVLACILAVVYGLLVYCVVRLALSIRRLKRKMKP
jgi:hypothetical protein